MLLSPCNPNGSHESHEYEGNESLSLSLEMWQTCGLVSSAVFWLSWLLLCSVGGSGPAGFWQTGSRLCALHRLPQAGDDRRGRVAAASRTCVAQWENLLNNEQCAGTVRTCTVESVYRPKDDRTLSLGNWLLLYLRCVSYNRLTGDLPASTLASALK